MRCENQDSGAQRRSGRPEVSDGRASTAIPTPPTRSNETPFRPILGEGPAAVEAVGRWFSADTFETDGRGTQATWAHTAAELNQWQAWLPCGGWDGIGDWEAKDRTASTRSRSPTHQMEARSRLGTSGHEATAVDA